MTAPVVTTPRVDVDVPTATLLALHEGMVLSREIELHCTRKTGHWYPSIGEEAAIVGTFSGLADGDIAAPHYRGALIVPWLRGRPLVEVMACLEHRRGSPTGGRLYGGFAGGLEHGVLPYVTMVLGPTLAMAAGYALAFRRTGRANVAVSAFGDGTAGTGDFHESLNLASTLHLPVVYVCQNNQFSISTPSSRGLACSQVSEWARGYRMPAVTVDGNDVLAVKAAVEAAIARARAGEGPSFVEALTYRRTGHFIADPAVYRSADEAAAWEERDPISRLEQVLRERGVPDQEIDARWASAQEQVATAAEEAAGRDPFTAADLGIGEAYGDLG